MLIGLLWPLDFQPHFDTFVRWKAQIINQCSLFHAFVICNWGHLEYKTRGIKFKGQIIPSLQHKVENEDGKFFKESNISLSASRTLFRFQL